MLFMFLFKTMSKEVILITDAYYRTALDNQMKARSDYYAKRAALEQFVGNDTFAQFEKDLKERDDSEKWNVKSERSISFASLDYNFVR